ncbi:SGNH/GDSL hydrolase family protein [Bradyrhizobium barranii subsp. barranii]|uniref:SGNH/GDSL hydrolase family protein n=1 Tax=Bradyrhizobium barranii subsp. barranii TaxID=2823807 RepID=A0A939S1Q5_9BRAD|nr:SGNH/GDSL hydrolase family protein [Bradyrhizobium barranii]UEM13486.1 SGNH/GDSL hydrolase family protein [Bradyrhizobium barranii subsp. barranii]
MSSLRPFWLTAWLAAPAAALLMLTPVSLAPVQAQATQATPAPQQAASPASASPSQTTVAATSHEQRGVTARAIDKVKQVAKSAGDIFSRVPCLTPKGGSKAMGSLPHVAGKLVAGKPVVIVAFGSSTAGYGASSPDFNYPNRLAAQLRRQYPTADITVINAGVGGEDAPEMMKRLQKEVIDVHPDLVIWQVGTNAVLRNLDPGDTAKMVEDGISRIQAAGGADIVLVDPQYSPAVNQRKESAGKMVHLLGKVAELRHVGIFPRFEVMRDWHENQSIPVESFVIADGLHMNDWGYACFAQILGDDIIRSVGQIKLGVNVPADVRTYRPM